MNSYKILDKQIFSNKNYSIVPIRFEDRNEIMKWRNEQIYHLRQAKPLTQENQDYYFSKIVSTLFEQEQPSQLLFSYLEDDVCIGYGGLVHINWIDKHAEISFVMNTELEKTDFGKHWQTYLGLIEQIAFDELNFHKIFTYAFDLRPHLYTTIEEVGYKKEGILKEHCLFHGEYKDVIIHSKISRKKTHLKSAKEEDAQLLFEWANDSLVRNNSFNSEPIKWGNHIKWFLNKLNSSDSNIFILCHNFTPIGQVRLDFVNGYWEIDYSIVKKYRGKGFGEKIIQLVSEKLDKNTSLKGLVKKENIASSKVFKKLKFEENIENESTLCYTLKIK